MINIKKVISMLVVVQLVSIFSVSASDNSLNYTKTKVGKDYQETVGTNIMFNLEAIVEEDKSKILIPFFEVPVKINCSYSVNELKKIVENQIGIINGYSYKVKYFDKNTKLISPDDRMTQELFNDRKVFIKDYQKELRNPQYKIVGTIYLKRMPKYEYNIKSDMQKAKDVDTYHKITFIELTPKGPKKLYDDFYEMGNLPIGKTFTSLELYKKSKEFLEKKYKDEYEIVKRKIAYVKSDAYTPAPNEYNLYDYEKSKTKDFTYTIKERNLYKENTEAIIEEYFVIKKSKIEYAYEYEHGKVNIIINYVNEKKVIVKSKKMVLYYPLTNLDNIYEKEFEGKDGFRYKVKDNFKINNIKNNQTIIIPITPINNKEPQENYDNATLVNSSFTEYYDDNNEEELEEIIKLQETINDIDLQIKEMIREQREFCEYLKELIDEILIENPYLVEE